MSKSNTKSNSKVNGKSKKNIKHNEVNLQNPYNPMMMQNPYNPMMIQNPYNPMMMQNPYNSMMLQNQFNPMVMQMQMQNQMMMQMQNPMMMQMQNQFNPIMQMQNPPIQQIKTKNIIKDIIIDENETDNDLEYDLTSTENDSDSAEKIPIKQIEKVNSKKRKIVLEENHENDENQENHINNDISINEKEINKEINKEITKEINNKDGNILANLFDNALDNRNLNKRQKKDKDVSFLPYKDGRNIINHIKPLDNANFNSETHPEEKYYVQFLDGHNETIQAKDINSSALETQKITSEHNQKIKTSINTPIFADTVIYVRCSKENDTSIDTQTQACFDYALKNKMKVLPFGYLKDNGISARNGKNFKVGELSVWLSHLPDESNIIVYSPDRWSRHTLKGLQELDNLILKKHITIHFVNNDIKYNRTTSSAHKAMIQSELMTAEKQSNDTSEKIKGTLNRLKAEGHIIGKAPYGFKNSVVEGIRKRLVNSEEKNTIQKIKDLYLDINKNFNKYVNDISSKTKINIIKYIIRWCIRNSIKNRNGLSFSISQIRTMIKL